LPVGHGEQPDQLALTAKARQTGLEPEAKAAHEQAAATVPLVNVMAPEDLVPPISIVITDSRGHTMRVVRQGRPATPRVGAEPQLNLED
jgi:hypothetical protein